MGVDRVMPSGGQPELGAKWWNFQCTMIDFVLFTMLMCYESIYNLLKRVTGCIILFLCKTVFNFPPFLSLGDQISSPENWYTDLISALDQSLVVYNPEFGSYELMIDFKHYMRIKPTLL